MNEYELINNILSDREKHLVQAFYENIDMREAVRKILLGRIYYMGVLPKDQKANITNWVFNKIDEIKDETELGKRIIATGEGLKAIENAFAMLSNIKIEDTDKVIKPNEAR